MRKNRISETIGNIDQKYVNEATAYTGEPKAVRRPVWIKWGTIAACFAIIFMAGIGILHLQRGNDGGMIGIEMPDREPIIVTIKEWKSEGFVCTVVDPDTHEFISEGYEVLILFNGNIKIDGTDFKYDTENPNAPECGLSVGTQVKVYFDAVNYKDYNDGTGMAHSLGANEIIPYNSAE